ncbi:unnamed protein product [Rotaria socialis]|uniref:Uncharacterized protein n=1 Tax=Rotaria socialis TaxID=392032 RepID=A0A820P999_9BILA|nr:unnamed protein product [Rotaria socialis]
MQTHQKVSTDETLPETMTCEQHSKNKQLNYWCCEKLICIDYLLVDHTYISKDNTLKVLETQIISSHIFFMRLFVGRVQTLRMLNMRGNQIESHGTEYIADILKIFAKLYLKGNQIEKQGAQHIASAVKTNQPSSREGFDEQTVLEVFVEKNKR